jgi:hypothetical protein
MLDEVSMEVANNLNRSSSIYNAFQAITANVNVPFIQNVEISNNLVTFIYIYVIRMTLYYVEINKDDGIYYISPSYHFYVVNSTISNNNGYGIKIENVKLPYVKANVLLCTVENSKIGIYVYEYGGELKPCHANLIH